ncbi:DUF3575 domain-containing protein [Rhodocytophaga aerolata]|uniref:DUF3575 domain-containing protein n=1 Tax=Rhodocytophaga aerolata TaxID=455078 RepID=A0ABT8QZI4_9BACT|nr:DUF3575 domain-containing protein [Rhodocytophaga aerolata]MDO1445248.1 DUF3575 domain-containing protein [Rhodocytophaga aerolata]
MKINYLVLCILGMLMLSVSTVEAQQRKPASRTRVLDIDDMPKNVIKLNILSLAVGTVSGFYERVINEQMSFQLGASYTNISSDWILDVRYKGYTITPEFRYYLSSTEAPRGFYAAPFVRYRRSDVTGNITRDGREIPANGKISAYGAGLMVGGQWIIGRHFSLDAFVGPSLNARSIKVNTPDVTEKEFPVPNILGVFGLRAGITVGVAF